MERKEIEEGISRERGAFARLAGRKRETWGNKKKSRREIGRERRRRRETRIKTGKERQLDKEREKEKRILAHLTNHESVVRAATASQRCPTTVPRVTSHWHHSRTRARTVHNAKTRRALSGVSSDGRSARSRRWNTGIKGAGGRRRNGQGTTRGGKRGSDGDASRRRDDCYSPS